MLCSCRHPVPVDWVSSELLVAGSSRPEAATQFQKVMEPASCRFFLNMQDNCRGWGNRGVEEARVILKNGVIHLDLRYGICDNGCQAFSRDKLVCH